jgi:hypothetical protein
MEPEDDWKLWDLLGRSAEPRLSPFFARNVLRKIRQEAGFFERTRNWLGFRRVAAASAVAVVVIWAAIAAYHPVPQALPANEADVVAKIDPQDYDVVADLDELVAWDENSLWDEKSNKPSL